MADPTKKSTKRSPIVNEEFVCALREHLRALRPAFSARQIAPILHVSPALLYKWRNGKSTPIWLARQATLRILESLRASCLGVREV